MAIKLQSQELHRYKLNKEEQLWVYNGLDCALTKEIAGVLRTQLEPETTEKTYRFSMAMHPAVLSMMQRGFRIDAEAVHLALHGEPGATYTKDEVGRKKRYETVEQAETETQNRRLGLYERFIRLGGMRKDPARKTGKWSVADPEALLQVLAVAIWDRPLNFHSPKQLAEFLYGALRLPEQTKIEKGKVKVLTNHEALEHLAQNYPRATVVCNIILELRGLEKLIEVLEKGIDEDGRMRCSFAIAGTETGRLSSSASVWDTGGNLQNITPELRRIFVPDVGYTLGNVDLEQAESRGVAYLAADEAYIKACESEDLHTTVACMLFKIDKEQAKELYYRHFTYRDMAKRAGHALNYGLSPASLARNMHISQKQAWRVYLLYLGGELEVAKAANLGLADMEHVREGRFWVFPGAFPGLKRWHQATAEELELNGYLTTPVGRKRTFWGRLTDGKTLREAIAFRPQSLIADMLNTGMVRIFNELPEVQLLAQVHDSLAFQIEKKKFDTLVPQVLDCLRVKTEIFGRALVIPAEMKVGPNWRVMEKWTQ